MNKLSTWIGTLILLFILAGCEKDFEPRIEADETLSIEIIGAANNQSANIGKKIERPFFIDFQKNIFQYHFNPNFEASNSEFEFLSDLNLSNPASVIFSIISPIEESFEFNSSNPKTEYQLNLEDSEFYQIQITTIFNGIESDEISESFSGTCLVQAGVNGFSSCENCSGITFYPNGVDGGGQSTTVVWSPVILNPGPE